MGRGGEGTDSGEGPHGKMLGAILTAGLVLVGTAIGVSCTPRGTLVRKHKKKSKDPAEESPKDAIPCINVTKRFATCLGNNGYDIKKCLIYFNFLKDCENN